MGSALPRFSETEQPFFVSHGAVFTPFSRCPCSMGIPNRTSVRQIMAGVATVMMAPQTPMV